MNLIPNQKKDVPKVLKFGELKETISNVVRSVAWNFFFDLNCHFDEFNFKFKHLFVRARETLETVFLGLIF